MYFLALDVSKDVSVFPPMRRINFLEGFWNFQIQGFGIL